MQNKRSAIVAKYKTKEVKQKSAIIFKVCHETGAQLGGMFARHAIPLYNAYQKTKNKRCLMKRQFFVVGINSGKYKFESR